ncbi:hypothetical protein [Falsiroseomonas oryzae]|uniref:hypothetical protein n=1 Tax=Falsiroseomonas oryzae TaxID=2766473 RepID=UPI0022EA1595|nr:hypothetical protein [Roseomonas sp. MO-31]
MSDSYFSYIFYAWNGDQWGGFFYDDTVDYNAGAVLYDYGGYYYISGETPQGRDLGSFGINEGDIYTNWYYDFNSGQFLTVESAGMYRTGTGGLGSEYDRAWNGAAWDDFGDGGFYQASAELPDSYFTWTFYAWSGDQWGGVLYDDSRDYRVGDVLYDSFGYYYISSEIEYGYDLTAGSGIKEGHVTTSWYWDQTAQNYLSVYSGGWWATGNSGLGSEYDYTWNGQNWDDFGDGGFYQSNGPASDSYYTWVFYAWSGDQWGGVLYDDSQDYGVGSIIYDDYGYYYISSEYVYGYDLGSSGIDEGRVLTTWYWDASSASFLSVASGGSYATGFYGLGSEYDSAWSGENWDDFGSGGWYQANAVPPDSYFSYVFYAWSGDQWGGYFYDDSRDYSWGSTVWDSYGYYYITGEYEYGYDLGWAAEGTVYTTWYWDAWSYSYLDVSSDGYYATGFYGLGSEYDYVWNGWRWDDFGDGGWYQASWWS